MSVLDADERSLMAHKEFSFFLHHPIPLVCRHHRETSPSALTSATLGIWDEQEYSKEEEDEQEAEVVGTASGSRVGRSHASWGR